jgi:hypothetical protein
MLLVCYNVKEHKHRVNPSDTLTDWGIIEPCQAKCKATTGKQTK